MPVPEAHLCYLDASKVSSPAGELCRLHLISDDNKPLGSVQGVLIDPAQRRVRYYVVKSKGWFANRRYLVPTEAAARVEGGTLRLSVDFDEVSCYREFDERLVRDFSPEDAITALFAQRVA
jgi:hypothetical protein